MVQGVKIFWHVTMCPHKNETFCVCWFLGAKAPLGLVRFINWYTKKFQNSKILIHTCDKWQVTSDEWRVTNVEWQVTNEEWWVSKLGVVCIPRCGIFFKHVQKESKKDIVASRYILHMASKYKRSQYCKKKQVRLYLTNLSRLTDLIELA